MGVPERLTATAARADESGAAHHETNGALGFAEAGDVSGFGDLGVAADGAVDVGPCGAGDCLGRCAHSGSEDDADRPLDVVGGETIEQLAGPEPRVNAPRWSLIDLSLSAARVRQCVTPHC